jgi:hypothetical protein
MKKLFLLLLMTGLMTSLTFALNHSGTISSNEAWFVSDNPHVITGNLIIADGVTLLIQPGCQIYFNGNYRFEVQGVLSANGTSQNPILFTSNSANPAKGDWRFIYFNQPDAGSIMNYCDVSYGGSVAARGMINFRNASNGLIISNCNLSYSGSYGIEYRNNAADPQIIDCSISNCDNYPIYTYADRVKDIAGNMNFSGNTPNSIYFRSQDVNTGSWQNFGIPYVIGGNFTVSDGQTLTINAGNVLKFNGANTITVEGTLVANGTPGQHIIFTSNQTTPASGDWNRIYFNGADAGCMLNYCDILYAGSATSALDINASGANLAVMNTTIENSAGYGVYIRNGSAPSFINSSIINNNGNGVYINGSAAATFGSNASEWNEIYGNGGYGLRNGTQNISAKYIYWGTEACGNIPNLIYDKSDQNNLGIVDYVPWLGMDHSLPSLVTTWTGASSPLWYDDTNWDNFAPCSMIDAVIPKAPANQPIVLFDDKCNDLTLEAGSQLTLFSGSSLQVYGDFFMEANTNGTASLVQNGAFTIAGNKKIQYYIDADRWHYVSSPLTSQVANTFFAMYLYSYNEATDLWDNIVDVNAPLAVGTGYKVWSSSIYPVNNPPGTKSVDFSGGNIGNGNYFLPVTRQNNGWNLVGNPYPSAVDWDNAGWIKSNISGTIYVWNGVQYITWNGSVGDLTGGVIPAMQGFMVKATAANPLLYISNNTRLHGVDPYKESNVDQLLEITVNGNGYSDKTFVNFNENATSEFDDQFDGYKIYGLEEAPQLYTRQGENILRANVLPKVSTGLFIPIGLEVTAETEYTIIVNGLSSFGEGVSVYLEDLKENVMIDLSEQIDYTFIASPLDEADRFILHFGVLGIEDQPVVAEKENDVYIYSNENSIYIKNNLQQDFNGQVIVYNIMGQQVLNRKLDVVNLNKIDLYTETGYYVVKVFSDRGVYSQKVFIK